MSVREATMEDEAALARIDTATWDETTSPVPPPPRLAEGRFFDASTRPEDVLVAEVRGQVRGYVTLRPAQHPEARRHVCDVVGLAVDPGAQGEGVGTELLEAAVARCRERGVRKVALRVLAPNSSARRLYERCGFVVEGVLAGEFLLEGHLVDDVLMARSLD